jgi:hypothetical protein
MAEGGIFMLLWRRGAIALATFASLVLSIVIVAEARTARACNQIEPTTETINLFDFPSSEYWVRQIPKTDLVSPTCSLERKNGRHKIQLQSGEAWVEETQFRKVKASGPVKRPTNAHTPAKSQNNMPRFEEWRETIRATGRAGSTIGMAQRSAKSAWYTQAQIELEEEFEEWGDLRNADDTRYHCNKETSISYRCTIEAKPRRIAPSVLRLPPPPANMYANNLGAVILWESLVQRYRQYITVYYATNRIIEFQGKGPIPLGSIGYGRSEDLKFGSALITRWVRSSDLKKWCFLALPFLKRIKIKRSTSRWARLKR